MGGSMKGCRCALSVIQNSARSHGRYTGVHDEYMRSLFYIGIATLQNGNEAPITPGHRLYGVAAYWCCYHRIALFPAQPASSGVCNGPERKGDIKFAAGCRTNRRHQAWSRWGSGFGTD